ncbi:outer membrane beta-barrel protein [Sphingobacterium hungaricum]|uniref:Outer membrane protein beta-barrel domain-containing protein n=1 Tax=Sphingobacterium hungaricum TaxID=2082723 RepID=A0A928V116_9SPHI|nr:outer membrane beta-barrel protein [Sphingobacterium hungaricum]MBE8714184.1 hypothetical protein [Sphingobacterium hungaricum]
MMFKRGVISLLFGIIIMSFSANAQSGKTVQGMLRDSASRIIAGASVELITNNDTLRTGSSIAGIFTFENVKSDQFTIRINSLGFESLQKDFTIPANQAKTVLPSIILKGIDNLIEEVVVSGVITIQVKGDTLEYSTKDLKLRDDALAEDALKKLEGVEVDKDGNVTAQGEEVKRVRINGKDFFGGDVKTATQNLPANIIDKIQIIDDYGDMANLTGNKTGDTEKVLNITIDPKYNQGHMSTLRFGYGTEDRYQATGMWMGMKEGSQISVLGNLNNINAPLFDFSTTGGGARQMRGGGGRGGVGGINNSTGLTNTGSIGVNFRHDFNDKLTVYGSYSYGRDDQDIISSSHSVYQYEIPEIIDDEATTNNITGNHRFESNIEWKPSETDFIKLTPQFGFSNSSTSSFTSYDKMRNGVSWNLEENAYDSKTSSPRYGISGLYNKRLSANGRNLFFNFNFNSSATESDVERIVENTLLDTTNSNLPPEEVYRRTWNELRNKSWNGGASVSYLEPISKYGKLEFSYDYNVNTYDNNNFQEAFNADESPLTDPDYNFDYQYDYSFSTHRFGSSFSFNNDKIKYSVGASVQPSILEGTIFGNSVNNEIHRTAFNFIPIARFEYKFSRQSNISVNYSGQATEPSVTQIQPFTDYSNPNFPISGNPDLNAEFVHSLRLNFRKSDFQTGNTFFAFARATSTENKIATVNHRTSDDIGNLIQETGYRNADGAFSVSSFYNYSKSWKEKTYSLSFNGGASYNNNVSFISSDDLDNKDNPEENLAKNWVLNQGINFRYNPSTKFELNPGVRYTFNNTYNTLYATTTNVTTWTPSINGNLNLSETWIFGADVSKSFNSGFGGQTSNVNPLIINAFLEKKFLKDNRGSFRLAAFDMLNQQTNISRTVQNNITTDSQTNRLARYFMLTFTYRFQKFALGDLAPQQGGPGQGGPGGGMRPPGM